MNVLSHDPLTLAYHELRSPLGLLATAARSVVEDSTDEAVRARCEIIVRTVERMLRTAEQVFDVARTAEHDDIGWFAPAEIVAQMALDLAAFDAPVDLHIGDGAATTRLYTSRGSVEAMLQSLLNNAVDHGEPGVPITVDMRCEGDALLLTISNRIGLVRRHSGLGVGLYLCRRLADQIGATLAIDADGRDYHVTIRVPLSGQCSIDEHVAETPHVA